MRHVLIIAYYFPPIGGIASLRMSRFATYLPDNGWRVTVLAPTTSAHRLDAALEFPEDQVRRARSTELSLVGKRALRIGDSGTQPAQTTGLRRALQTAARRVLYFPDAQIGWYRPAVRVGLDALRQNSFDAIFSSAHPATAHLIGRRLHRASGIPWIAEYRDPFSDDMDGVIRHRLASALEGSVARTASAVVTVSPSLARDQEERWHRPVTVITNGCDGPIQTHPHNSEEFVLAHLGTLYPDLQYSAGVWQAIQNLTQSTRPEVDRLCFIGDPQYEVRRELDQHGLAPLVEITGFLPRDQALKKLGGADALLIIGPEDGSGPWRGWSPGKMFEYLATDLPIIYAGSTETDAANILRQQPGCYVLDGRDVAGLMGAIRQCRGQRHARDVERFTRRSLARELAAVLDRACGKAAGRTMVTDSGTL